MSLTRFHHHATTLFARKRVGASGFRMCLMSGTLRGIHQMPALTYMPPSVDEVEDIENYRPGGLHPVTIGSVLNQGRYRLVHKLGDGGWQSTVWLARDLLSRNSVNSIKPLVCVKILQASDESTTSKIPKEMKVTQALHELAVNRGCDHVRSQLLFIHSSFREVGPNGTHTCLVSSVGGPNLQWTYWQGLGRYRSDLARKICRQVAETLQLIHNSGYVHGGKHLYVYYIACFD
jgi:serine/threonine-protein kinase SRPK3